mmetsp:Transcript_4199/g.6214  ORF Transcript_4199/g.6214 Transcript_4199/m.6214 type:complete len:326 (-) Transcript_4199:89-1066(-)|eukprot:CAMPEP_0172428918 /NCGR_PEP_ID=MMETSP1064-20121228/48292_1 /TAXON_ID=202472 /ORGANISM="Aulacoseira subarctica , Strain CCAP 1002/5" /LENGTH=325 /DNA_ID=CAMNT_0013173975 /DNA_START=37 /DNA_END=1014 /DNA_ORIENTATION=-
MTLSATKSKQFTATPQCNILATSSHWLPPVTQDNFLWEQTSSFYYSGRDGRIRDPNSSVAKRVYLSDQKKPFEHFKPKSLLISTCRVVFVQAATTVSTVVADQLHTEMEREISIQKGLLTPDQAEKDAEEWDRVHVRKCFERFPHKCMNALIRFHAATLMMRWYEHKALSLFSIRAVDKLTKDTYTSAKRKYARNNEDRVKTGTQMFSTSLRASAIAVLSDLTVQQAILSFGYGLYYYNYILKLRGKRKSGKDAQACTENNLGGGILLKFSLMSSSLLVSRAFAWLASGVGACLGTMLLPGWGTIAGAQLFDGFAGSLCDVDLTI